MPTPSRQNSLMYQPGTNKHFPTLVFEIVVTNENRERLLSDAADKYFNVHTSVQCWVGVKVDLSQNTFWAGWGRRALIGYGLRLEEQTEDNNGVANFLSVYPYPQQAIVGQFTIPSTLIFHPLPLPPNIPAHLVINLEELRQQIELGIDQM
jgi:hypothetical protein